MYAVRRALQVLGYIALAVLSYVVFVLTVVRLIRHYRRFPAPPLIATILNNPLRRQLQPPAQVVGWMDIRWGMQVLEVGPGPGTFTVEAARRVGPAGCVYAVDIQPQMTARLDTRLHRLGIRNVKARTGSAYELPFPDCSLDRVFLVTVLAEIPDRQRALNEFRRVLKPDGLLAIGEFVVDPDYPLPGTVERWCEEAGFKPAGTYGTPLHYVLLFTPGTDWTAAQRASRAEKAAGKSQGIRAGGLDGEAVEFANDEAGYLAWLADYPDGFVVNAERAAYPGFTVLHRASCVYVNDYAPGDQWGGFTERRHIKVCAPDVEVLREWVRSHGHPDGSFSSTCSSCNPLSVV